MSHHYWRIDLQVTESCNLACPYCFARRSSSADMPLAVARQAVRWALSADRDKAHLTLWGGEPLIRLPLLRAIVDDATEQAAAAGKTLSLSMPTNATLLTEDALSWINDNDVRIFLSIDGDAESQAGRPLRGGGSSFALAAAGLRRALGTAPPPAVRMTVTPENSACLAHNVEFFVGSGVQELLIYPAFDGQWSADALQSFAASQRALAAWLIEQLAACSSPAQVPRLKAWLPILRGMVRPSPRQRAGPLRSCGAGDSLVAVDAAGRLSPCHRFLFYQRARDDAAFELGDLQAVANGHGVAEVAARLSSLCIEQRAGEQPCAACDVFDLCTIGCVAINYATTGDLQRVPEVACQLMRSQIAACQRVAEAFAGDPRLALYAGLSLQSTLRNVAGELGQQAWQLYCSDPPVQ